MQRNGTLVMMIKVIVKSFTHQVVRVSRRAFTKCVNSVLVICVFLQITGKISLNQWHWNYRYNSRVTQNNLSPVDPLRPQSRQLLRPSAITGCSHASRTHLITRETDKLQQLERPRGQHGNHLQEELNGGIERQQDYNRVPFFIINIPVVFNSFTVAMAEHLLKTFPTNMFSPQINDTGKL